MQDRNQTGHDSNPAGRNPNPAGMQKGQRGSGQKTTRSVGDAPRVDDAERRADQDRRPDISRAPGDRAGVDPKNAGATTRATGSTTGAPGHRSATGHHGVGTTSRTERDAPEASKFVKGSGSWRSMKSWQPWALIGAAVLFVVIALVVL